MVRLAISFGISLALVLAWAVISTLLLVTVLRGNQWFLENQSFPLMPVVELYKLFFSLPKNAFVQPFLLMTIGSAVLYTAPIYLVLTAIARFLRSRKAI
ncbi:MAG: hypothetical protein KA956_14480 [Pyrinomonadaceae bacterium]|nr:hypothetical protein [Acidobacteriota bacterium]MBP7377675.1 hypothetical protein [Pyrinomonadaceae bacterium]